MFSLIGRENHPSSFQWLKRAIPPGKRHKVRSKPGGQAELLVPQDRQPLVPVLDIRHDHLQLQTVVQGLQDLLLGDAEIRHLIGGGEKGDGGDGASTALVGVLALVQGGEQGIERSIVAFKDLIQDTDVRLGILPDVLTGGSPL